ncbi:MAG: methyltransferase domain-containing protein [Deltaproteobacteria bacterium]|nr:methyltransferase domain-containing protein [Deltaproteobacteria bacterium]
MTVQSKRTLKVEKLARIYDEEIAPVWGTRFGKMLLRNLALPEKGQVLDISCGTGYPTIEILRRMRDGSRLIAIDASSAMLDVARRKVADMGPLGKKGIFFRTESPVPKLSFADDVYDLVVCNLGLNEMPSAEVALRDFARVCKLGGEVRCTLPLAGTFQEFHDLFREVLIKHDKHEALDRLERYVSRFPSIDHVERCMKTASLSGGLEIEEFTLLFKSSREFFFAPVIEYGPLAEWKEIAGAGQEMQDVFWYIKEAIDAYFAGGPFSVTVKAGCLIGRKQEPMAPAELEVAIDIVDYTDETDDDDDVDTGLPLPPHKIAAGSVRVADPEDLEVEEVPDDGSFEVQLDVSAEADLDAFIEGRKRPSHLDSLSLDDLED